MKKIFLSAATCLMIILWLFLTSLPDSKLHIFVLDVGQGDSILVRTPTNEYILIDGGQNDKVLSELGKVMPFYEKRLDLVIMTHPHPDHVNGLVEVLKRYSVGAVLMSGVNYRYSGYTSFLEQIGQHRIHVLYAGAKTLADNSTKTAGLVQIPADYRLGGVILDMLFPFDSEQGRSFENHNNGSIVFRLLYGKHSFYFSGDLEIEGEEKLVASGLSLHANFLKVGHHGSRTASSEPLLNRIRPQFAAISCGVGNSFKHPHPEVMANLQHRQVRIYRTDLNGIIEMVSDGMFLEGKSFGK